MEWMEWMEGWMDGWMDEWMVMMNGGMEWMSE